MIELQMLTPLLSSQADAGPSVADENAFIVLFCVATAVAIAVRRFSVPYTVALVVTGLGLGALQLLEAPHLTKDLLFAVFLPGLLFEAAFHLDFTRVRENSKTILALAVPGIAAAIGLTALFTASMVRALDVDPTFTLRFGLVFGAVVAATDPIAVVGLFRSLNVPARLSLLIEGESLLNDGTAIVFFSLILAFVTGDNPTAGSLVAAFFRTTVGGALIGIVVGGAASQVTKRIDEPTIEITLTVIAAYGSFVAAEHYHVSGVIATVAAGLVCGNYGRKYGMSPTTRMAVESFWEYVAFALNSVVFLLIGLDVAIGSLASYWSEILVATAAVIAARIGVVFGVTTLLRRTAERVPAEWSSVLAWGGIRGALSIVLALGLPRDLPHRDQLVTMTVGVVLASILLQGTTMAPLLRRLGLAKTDTATGAYEQARTQLRTSSLALKEIDQMLERHAISPRDAGRLRKPYEERLARARQEMEALHATEDDLALTRRELAVRQLLALEQDTVAQDLRDGVIMRGTHDKLARDVAGRLVHLESGDYDDPSDLLAKSDAAAEKPGKPAGEPI
jgi:CPA1 family monovalent cation:H+ antiporter